MDQTEATVLEDLIWRHEEDYVRPLPLVRHAGIWLPVLRAGDDARFARLFKDTWRRLPYADRRCLLRYWRDNEYRPDGSTREFSIKMVDHLLGESKETVATCSDKGFVFEFAAAYIEAMPEEHVMTVIAHELMHALMWAMGKAQSLSPETRETETEDHLILAWGFDQRALDDWLADNSDAVNAKWVVSTR